MMDSNHVTTNEDSGGYSTDFPSSQQCFSVGWDWSGSRSNKPTIRVVERTVRKRGEQELMQCQRKRQFINKSVPENVDESAFFEKLKSFAAGFKSVPESTSPVASPPHNSIRRRDLLVTPTALRKPAASSKSDESPCSTTVAVATGRSTSFEENLNDLLDDSLAGDLLKCTQAFEEDLQEKELKTPIQEESTSSKRKHRLSLSSSKDSKTVCRRINVSEKQPTGKTLLALTKDKEDKQNNNKNSVSKREISFDELDEATLLTLGELEESAKGHTQNVSSKTVPGSEVLEDDEFVSPDILSIIDAMERKATQEKPIPVSNGNSLSKMRAQPEQPTKRPKPITDSDYSILDVVDALHGAPSNKTRATSNTSSKKSLSLSGTDFKYTPAEIEKKRQDARKRLQLKKKK